jgi:hypothetical protein
MNGNTAANIPGVQAERMLDSQPGGVLEYRTNIRKMVDLYEGIRPFHAKKVRSLHKIIEQECLRFSLVRPTTAEEAETKARFLTQELAARSVVLSPLVKLMVDEAIVYEAAIFKEFRPTVVN